MARALPRFAPAPSFLHELARWTASKLQRIGLWRRKLRRRHPSIDVNPDVLYVDNGAVLTSAGAAAGMDLCLHLVRRDLGAEVAAHTARAAVMPLERSGGQAQYIVYEQPAAVESMGPLLLWIEQNLDDRLPLSVIARHAAMSTRTLSRRFLEQVGATPTRTSPRNRDSDPPPC